MTPAHRRALLFAATLLSGACGAGAPGPRTPGTIRAQGAAGLADPTVTGARLVPAEVDITPAYGVEAGGGVRTITEGVRVINLARGGALSARDRLPQVPTQILPLPARMGGGFFYLVGTAVWRSSSWLSTPVPVFRAPQTVADVFAGLDRVYLRLQSGAHVALDARTGAPVDRGPLPGTPFLGPMIAVDGWHAVAIADLRGVVSTDDAGVTWRSIRVPFLPSELRRVGDAVYVGGRAGPGSPQAASLSRPWVEVQRGGFALGTPSPDVGYAEAEAAEGGTLDALARTFGRRPLLAAIEDGWPLADGTAVVARNGDLLRLRLSDGTVAEHAPDAYPLKPSRCHPTPMGAPGAFGFVCGEAKGRTELYAFEDGRMVPVKSFDRARRVSASGNGALVVHGGCSADAPDDEPSSAERLLCVRSRAGEWREVRLSDATCVHKGAGGACEEHARNQRLVSLASGALVVLSPPEAGNLGAARLTILDGPPPARSVPIVFLSTSDTTAGVVRALRLGMWMDGFEERTPGTLAGWVELGGVLLGVQIKLDGAARHGVLLQKAGSMLASGRWGLDFAGARRGYETTDGGMTWAPIDLPDPIAQGRTALSRGCGPVGCVAAGWLRVGWGARAPDVAGNAEAIPTVETATLRPTMVALTCELVRTSGRPAIAPVAAIADNPWRYRYGHGRIPGPYAPGRPRQTFNWTPFFDASAPKLGTTDLGFSNEARDAAGLAGPTARLYAWGPKEGDWDKHNRWLVRWMWPFGSEVRGTQASPTPRAVLDSSGLMPLVGQPRSRIWTAHPGDDSGHTLLVGRPSTGGRDNVAYDLEAGHAAVEVRRDDGEPLAEIESAVRVAGRWLIATREDYAVQSWPATVLWEIDGGVAQELTRLPRTTDGNSRVAVRLARRSDERAIGVIVDGQPNADRLATAQRWVVPVDLESAAIGDIESLGPIDLADRAVGLCRGDEGGWVVDLPWSSSVRIEVGGTSSSLRNALARARLATHGACLERLSATGDIERAGKGPKLPPAASAVEVSVLESGARSVLRCAAR